MPLTLFVVQLLLIVLAVNSKAVSNETRDESEEADKHILYFLSMLPYPDPNASLSLQPRLQNGPDIVPAAYLAVEQINNRSDILGDYHIELIESDGGCDITTKASISFMSNIFHSGKQIVGVIGPECSGSTQLVSSLARKTDLINVHIAQTPELADRTLYPNTFGTFDSYITFVNTVYSLMEKYDWRKVAVLYEDKPIHVSTFAAFEELIIKGDPAYEVVFSSVVTDTYMPLKAVEDSTARVIITIVGEEVAEQLACMAYHRKLLFPAYQWIIAGSFPRNRITTFHYSGEEYICTEKQMIGVTDGSIGMYSIPETDYFSTTTVSGLNYFEYEKQYNECIQNYNRAFLTHTHYSQPFYDAVWSLALALNNSIPELEERNLSLSEYQYGRKDITEVIRDQFYELNFEGVSGRIKFDPTNGYVSHTVYIFQTIVLDDSQYIDNCIGNYSAGKLTIQTDPLPLEDYHKQHVHVAQPAAVAFLVVTAIALLLTIAAHIISIVYRKRKSVKATSVRLNHLAYVGCYLLILGILLITVTVSFPFELSSATITVLCNIIPWCLNCGLTLMFGTICMRTLRLYQIFVVSSKQLTQISHSRMFEDKFLACYVLLLVMLDIILCSIWIAVDPFRKNVHRTIQYNPGEVPVIVTTKYWQCEYCYIIWLPIAIGCKVLLLIFTVYLAFCSRKIPMRDFKTKSVIILAYLISFVVGLGIPLYFILTIKKLEINVNVHFAVLCSVLDTLVYLCVFFLFFPPLLTLVKRSRVVSTVKSMDVENYLREMFSTNDVL